MAVQLGPKIALEVGKAIARKLKVPVSELTKDMVRKAPVPVRYKKLFFGPSTKGETKISPSIKSSRTVAKQEGKALGTGLGIGITAGTAAEKIEALEKERQDNTQSYQKPKEEPKPSDDNLDDPIPF